MSRSPGKFLLFIANLVWLITCIPGWIAFLIASRNIRRTQWRVLARILKSNSATDHGRKYQFEAISTFRAFKDIPLSEYDDYLDAIKAIRCGREAVLTADPVDLLQPTSGSTAATKLIPYARSLRREFRAAVNPWIASLYLAFPGLLIGRHYWSISPSTPPPADMPSKVRIGFADDSEYLGIIQRFLTQVLFAVPAEIARVKDQHAFEYLTLLFLCREKNLRLVSIWHPSFLTVLLRALPGFLPSLLRDIESGTINPDLQLDADARTKLLARLSPLPARARELLSVDMSMPGWPQSIWPRLRVISCWTDGVSEPWVSEIAGHFPRAFIQGKGLTATEGIMTFPLGRSGQKACAIRSHYLEFIDDQTGKIHNAWEVETAKQYSLVVTTGGGLYRYRLHDLVKITGFYNQTPCLNFLSRDNLVSDLVGEKLSAPHVEVSVRNIERKLASRFKFAMLAPDHDGDRARYALFIESDTGQDLDLGLVAHLMEEELQRNYHYRHARSLSQLEPLGVFLIKKDAGIIYRRHLTSRGIKAGDIKFNMLSLDRTWVGEFLENISDRL